MTKPHFSKVLTSSFLLASTFFCNQALAQAENGLGAAKQIFEDNCSSCHGETLTGGIGPSLVDNEWKHGDTEAQITNSITSGYPEAEMPSFQDVLSKDVIRSLVIYMAEERSLAKTKAQPKIEFDSTQIFSTDHQNFKLERVIKTESEIWSLDFLPNGCFLATERTGQLLLVSKKGKIRKIKNSPKVWAKGQGGLLDVKLHPNYNKNGWIYLSYASSPTDIEDETSVGMTRIVRGRIKRGSWTNEEVMFQAKPEHETGREFHFGSRIEFVDGYVYFSVGDRGDMDKAQDLTWPNGKIHRLHDDGSVPKDNPFVGVENAYPSIFSYGHRNPQGLTVGSVDGRLYNTEHGPRGGDELNAPEAGKNYGWPKNTYGMNYDGTPMTSITAKEGMEQPIQYWVPSIATSGVKSVSGKRFANWQGDLLVAGLQSEEIHRLRLNNSQVEEHEILLKGLGRVRDITVGSDGYIYAVMNEERHGPSVVYRMIPQ